MRMRNEIHGNNNGNYTNYDSIIVDKGIIVRVLVKSYKPTSRELELLKMAHKTSGVRGEKERDTLFDSGGAGGVGTTAGGQAVLHEVGEVYVYIPPELSAAGVELKIVGSVRVINKVYCMYVLLAAYTIDIIDT